MVDTRVNPREMTNFRDGLTSKDVGMLKNVKFLRLYLPIEAYMDVSEEGIAGSHSFTQIKLQQTRDEFPCLWNSNGEKYLKILEDINAECIVRGINVEIYVSM